MQNAAPVLVDLNVFQLRVIHTFMGFVIFRKWKDYEL